jgi:hypothetical protein
MVCYKGNFIFHFYKKKNKKRQKTKDKQIVPCTDKELLSIEQLNSLLISRYLTMNRRAEGRKEFVTKLRLFVRTM